MSGKVAKSKEEKDASKGKKSLKTSRFLTVHHRFKATVSSFISHSLHCCSIVKT